MDRASDSGSECWGFESLRAYQARIDCKVYPSFFLSVTFAAVANQASCFALAFLGRDPQRPGVPPAHRASLRLRAYQNKRHDQRSCLLFWVPAAIGGLHPPVIQMLGAAKPPLRNSPPPPAAPNLRRTCGAGQKAGFVLLRRRIFLSTQNKTKGTLTECLSFCISPPVSARPEGADGTARPDRKLKNFLVDKPENRMYTAN